ncbi:MATE family efflux transporter [Faecalibacterium sp. Marseille-Q3530]|uniref:MATE family efflux transporter n=1 Tax=Faecalibacterium sp. Marseille-Q3530 TaxID=2758403 RepID=UPI001A9AC99E|nr:MATE family efflux transporter [Faecalibacterium sp. Marseille-Q3530]MBO1289465.1 polysaccharide biosynthesis C-terminal domain-containing protein [Faecalibacterium sp. Marseille-Q3530]
MNLTKQFFKYVSQNIFGLLGTSCYILADTYFIAQAAGTDGVTLLNLCLPIYNLIFAFGSMIGLGAATRYAILRAQGDARAQYYFSNAIFSVCILAVPFMLVGIFRPDGLLRLMGGDADIVALGMNYARIFLMFTPFFMCNYVVASFVRNDGDPSLAMVATLSGSLFNVVFDYIFIFPMGLGLPGAALATAISPILSIAVCSAHFIKKSNTITFVRKAPSVRLLAQSCQLGISGFVGELSSGVTTTVFNFLLLRLAGNVAVAAYGVVANFALVATAIFNGVAQGAQPLVSQCYGKNEMAGARKLLLLGCGTALGLAALLYGVVFGYTDALTALFNSENSALMAEFAHSGMRIYFVGYFFAGCNIVAAGYLGAVNRPAEASITSLCRGMVAIVVCSLVLSALFGMNGVWAAFPVSEAITLALTVFLLKRKAGRA